jgi:hypothetical protein
VRRDALETVVALQERLLADLQREVAELESRDRAGEFVLEELEAFERRLAWRRQAVAALREVLCGRRSDARR